MFFLNTNYKGSVFFDLDGTLFNNNSKIDTDVSSAISELKLNNYLPVVNTGRSIIEIGEVTNNTNIDTFVTLNGSYVEYKGKSLFESTIKTKYLDKLVSVADSFGEPLSFHASHSTCLNISNDITHSFYNSVHIQHPKVDSQFYTKINVPMTVIITKEDASKYQRAIDELSFYKSGPSSVDAVNKNVSKMSGIKELLSHLNLNDKPVYAFGDSDNDYPMIKFANYGIAMGNANDSIKSIATYITSSNTDGGIIHGLKHFNLI